MRALRWLFSCMKLDGCGFGCGRIAGDFEHFIDDGLDVVEDGEDLAHHALRLMRLCIMGDVVKSLLLIAFDASDIRQDERGELSNDLSFCVIVDLQVDDGGMDGMSQFMIVDHSVIGAKADGVRVQRVATEVVRTERRIRNVDAEFCSHVVECRMRFRLILVVIQEIGPLRILNAEHRDRAISFDDDLFDFFPRLLVLFFDFEG